MKDRAVDSIMVCGEGSQEQQYNTWLHLVLYCHSLDFSLIPFADYSTPFMLLTITYNISICELHCMHSLSFQAFSCFDIDTERSKTELDILCNYTRLEIFVEKYFVVKRVCVKNTLWLLFPHKNC